MFYAFTPLTFCTFYIILPKGMVDVKDLRPYVMRLFPSARRRLAKLPATRKALKADLRAMVKKIGPSMGKLCIRFNSANLRNV